MRSDTPGGSFNRRNTRHGLSNTPTYGSWLHMKWRCLNGIGRHKRYLGIPIYPRWMVFAHFLADMGLRPAGTTLDRIDNSKGYEPSNCRWATNKEQGSNRGCVDLLTFNGKTMNPEDWARELGVKPQSIRRRISRGWSVEATLSLPYRRRTS